MQTCCPTRSLVHPELELGDKETMNKISELDDSLLTQRDRSLDNPTNGTASKLLICSVSILWALLFSCSNGLQFNFSSPICELL